MTRPACPKCGDSHHVYARLDVRWSPESGCWKLLPFHGDEPLDCTECDAEWFQPESPFPVPLAGLGAALRWAIGMAEKAIAVREEGDDPEDSPDVIAMHRDELAKARALLVQVEGAQL